MPLSPGSSATAIVLNCGAISPNPLFPLLCMCVCVYVCLCICMLCAHACRRLKRPEEHIRVPRAGAIENCEHLTRVLGTSSAKPGSFLNSSLQPPSSITPFLYKEIETEGNWLVSDPDGGKQVCHIVQPLTLSPVPLTLNVRCPLGVAVMPRRLFFVFGVHHASCTLRLAL